MLGLKIFCQWPTEKKLKRRFDLPCQKLWVDDCVEILAMDGMEYAKSEYRTTPVIVRRPRACSDSQETAHQNSSSHTASHNQLCSAIPLRFFPFPAMTDTLIAGFRMCESTFVPPSQGVPHPSIKCTTGPINRHSARTLWMMRDKAFCCRTVVQQEPEIVILPGQAQTATDAWRCDAVEGVRKGEEWSEEWTKARDL